MAMRVEKDLRMASGDGENSYAANSRTPEKAILENRPLLQKAIQGAYTSLSGERAMVVADLGCSSGPNTLLVVAEVLRTISSQNMDDHRAVELQFFLNDLPSNDFNLIFQSLDQLQHLVTGKEEAGSKEIAATPPPCYVARLPGSFYKRLFPSESARLFHSSYCLHWLAKVPYELSAGNYQNEGNIHIGKTTPQTVIKLFTEQFQNDFELFLTLRSEELVSGGRMLLTFLGRKGEPMLMRGEIGTMWELLTESRPKGPRGKGKIRLVQPATLRSISG
uniref:Uncharacterized protein n=1 Tax=Avena sativa TaxID=4498 RepID=A0ACD5ZHD1_AVESA